MTPRAISAASARTVPDIPPSPDEPSGFAAHALGIGEQPFGRFLRRQGAGKQEALRVIAAQCAQDGQLLFNIFNRTRFFRSKNMLLDHIFPLLEEAISEGQINVFYESILAQLIKTKTLDLVPMIISGNKWVEIDNHEDLAQAENTFAELH